MSAGLIRGNAVSIPLRDECVDLIVTSPPYFALRSYRDDGEHYGGQIGSEPTPRAFLGALWSVMHECWRVLKPEGVCFVNLGDKRSGSGGCACPSPTAPTTPAVILDPFVGTGTVPMVARALGRYGVGIDLSADYLRLAKWRTFDSRHAAKAVARTEPRGTGADAVTLALDDGSTSWRNGCETKPRYATRSEAKAFAKKVKRRYHVDRYPYGPCRHCEGFHLTSQPPDRLRTDTGS